jgi:putative glutamine amidotransferase
LFHLQKHYQKHKPANQKKFDFVILTGGGSIPSEYYNQTHDDSLQANRDKTEKTIIEYALVNKKPILGICRGMEYINGLFGGKSSKHIDLHTTRPIRMDHPVCIGKEKIIKVNNYHNDGIYKENLAEEFKVLALDKENHVVESFYSNDKKILCVQWHPERAFEDDNSLKESTKLVINFIKAGGCVDESYYFSSRSGN